MISFFKSIGEYLSPELINNTRRLFKFLLVYTIGFFILLFGIKYAVPLVIALIIALILRPIKNRILSINKRFKKFKLTEGFVSLVLTLLLVSILGILLFFIGYQIIDQLKNYYTYITDKETMNNVLSVAKEKVQDILNNVDNINPDIAQNINEGVSKIISAGTSIIAKLVQNIINIIVSIPTGVIITIITIVSTFFVTKEIDNILVKIKGAFSEKGLILMRSLKKKRNEIFGGYIKAYSIILTVIGIYSSFIYMVIGMKYAVVIGILTAVLDALPLIGAGMVYSVIAIINLASGNIKGAIIMVIGYIGAVAIRQFLEQKLVSSFLGVHPLVIIIALFLAFTPVGFLGTFYFLGAFVLYGTIKGEKDV
ncbi:MULTISPECIES: AI-2E family transporter [Clostridium]|uniref:AI-2E family transporter n=1 Tax=Clostridium cibarium TaxID=2762247 RepID=A0ABR8PTJ8_9CLOT|nr:MULTISPECIES: AI-2E family transporter [Clostridium]MBD7911491.1 AI-2E family transporter [Clostridium cibarium]